MVTTTYKRPGAYLSEVLAPAIVDTGVSLSTGCLIGTNPKGPVAPTLVSSWNEYTALYGGFVAGVIPSDLTYAAYLYFQNGGANLFVIRVLAGTEAVATIGLPDRESGTPQNSLVLTAVNPGTWGNAVAVGIADSGVTGFFDLYVFNNGVQVERFPSLSMDPTNAQYVLNVVNSPVQGSHWVTATAPALTGTPTLANQIPAVTGTTGPPFVLVPVSLAGGLDQTAAPVLANWSTALGLADNIANPITMNLAGQIGPTFVSAAIVYCENRQDAFLVVDPITTVGGTAPTAAAQVTAAASLVGNSGSSSYAGLYYPRLVIADPASRSVGATRVVAPGGGVLGRFASADAAKGVQQTAAGIQYGRLSGVLGTEVVVSDADADLLNPVGINAIRSNPGNGICLFGGRTMRQVGQADKYISVRRTLIYVKAELKVITAYALFEPNEPGLWESLDANIEIFLVAFWQSGGLKGNNQNDAFYITVDETNNTPTSVANGELHMDIGVAPLTPAEFLAIRVSQYNGSVVSVSEAAAA